jgi:uridine kinase
MLKHKYRLAGVFIGIAIGMKFSLALVLPFLILFAWDNPRFKRNIWITTVVSFVTGLIFYTPGLYSPGFQKMVFNNEESMKSLEYFISFQSQKVLLLPLIYIILLYWLWKAGRISIDVLIAFFGVALLLVSVFSPASIGWMLWGLPLMFMNLAKERRSRIQLFIIQSIFLFQSISAGIKIQTIWGEISTPPVYSIISDLVFTLGVVLVLLYSYSSLKATIKHGDRYKISKAPLTVSVAGDSGTGKDTLSHALVNMFTSDTATILCGDDYHKYERGDSAWERTTHLNPTANYLDLWEKDIRFAHQRQNFEQREYDHNSGKFSQLKPRDRRDLLISQGLHGLYSRLTEYSDICIFLSMSDELRIKFKVARDSATRGHTHDSVLASIENRSSDYLEFVAPQVENSDIHFHIYESDAQILLQVAAVSNFAIDEFIKSLVHSSGISVLERDRFNRKVYEINPLGVSSTILTEILNNQLRDYDQLFLEAPNISEGVLGIMATLSIVMLANKRDELYE